jgi:hypothetical protein
MPDRSCQGCLLRCPQHVTICRTSLLKKFQPRHWQGRRKFFTPIIAQLEASSADDKVISQIFFPNLKQAGAQCLQLFHSLSLAKNFPVDCAVADSHHRCCSAASRMIVAGRLLLLRTESFEQIICYNLARPNPCYAKMSTPRSGSRGVARPAPKEVHVRSLSPTFTSSNALLLDLDHEMSS